MRLIDSLLILRPVLLTILRPLQIAHFCTIPPGLRPAPAAATAGSSRRMGGATWRDMTGQRCAYSSIDTPCLFFSVTVVGLTFE